MSGVQKQVTMHGRELCYADAGDGPALLLVHGLMSSHTAWSGQLSRLSDRHRVVAPDLYGHGASAKPAGDYSLGAHAASLRDLLDALDIPSVTVVGHSYGGGIAMQLAYLFPERVERTVLVSSGGLGRELNPLLRAATLPGSELVMLALASPWLRSAGDAVERAWSGIGLPAASRSTVQAWHGLASLADADTRRAFLATSRAVIDRHGQTVSAQDRLPVLANRP